MKITLCGRDITNEINYHLTTGNREILEELVFLNDSYKCGIFLDDRKIYIEEYKVDLDGLFMKHKETGEIIRFYDTLCDENYAHLYHNSEHNLEKRKFFIEKIGYIGDRLTAMEIFGVNAYPF